MCTKDAASDLEIAIDVFKSRNTSMIAALKNFLLVLPTPQCIEEVLITALYRTAETDLDACRWLVRNRNHLMPELDLVQIARNFVLNKFRCQGLKLEQDFNFDAGGKLYLSEAAKQCLIRDISPGDRLLLEEILQVE